MRVAPATALVLLAIAAPVLAADGAPSPSPDPLLWTTALAWLVPVGLGMLACGATPAERVAAVVRIGWLALGVSAIGYWLCGFAFQFGGLGFVSDQPGLAGLVRQWIWAPIGASWGSKWGVLGLTGYMLRGPASTPAAHALFFSQLPWIATAVAIPLWSLQGRARPFTLFLSGILMAIVYTFVGNWAWGGGWLANLGLNLDLGHGFVDFAGAGAIHLAGAASAFAGMLAFGTRTSARTRPKQLVLPTLTDESASAPVVGSPVDDRVYTPMPPLPLPVWGTLGAWLVLIGYVGWVLSSPAQVIAGLDVAWTPVLIALILAAAGGAITSLAYSWLTTGQGDALMVARGVLAALIAVGAALPFVPLWAAVVVGAGAGFLVPLVHYLIEHVLRLDDPTSAIATHGLSALWGLLAVGLFADGHAGQGWNQTGIDAYLGVGGQGITGYLADVGFVSDWPGQIQAQATGVAAICIAAFFVSWLLFASVQGLTHAWQGEYTIRLPRRPRPRPKRPGAPRRRGPRIRFLRAAPGPEPGVEPADDAARPRRRSPLAIVASAWRRGWRRVKGIAPRMFPSRRQRDATRAREPEPGPPDEVDPLEP